MRKSSKNIYHLSFTSLYFFLFVLSSIFQCWEPELLGELYKSWDNFWEYNFLQFWGPFWDNFMDITFIMYLVSSGSHKTIKFVFHYADYGTERPFNFVQNIFYVAMYTTIRTASICRMIFLDSFIISYHCAPSEIEQHLMNQTNTEELHFSIGSGGQKNSLENKDFEGKVIHHKYFKQ